jgi:hypothetical protein
MRRVLATFLLFAAVALAPATQSAFAGAPIEGIWSFNGGEVGIQGQPDGTLTGTVVAPTKFSQCFHPTGEQMWTQMREQPDGSYWGLHQWYFETAECVRNPELGLTAWRVLNVSGGARVLKVCFSAPGSKSQPTIAPNGTVAGATYGCSESARVSALPVVKPSEAGKYIILPARRGCFGRSKMRIHLRDPASDPLAKISVKLRSGKIQRRAKLKRTGSNVTATLNLKGLPPGTFKVTVRVQTVLGTQISRRRTYRLCPVAAPHGSHHSTRS